jgi:hypothetical protein
MKKFLTLLLLVTSIVTLAQQNPTLPVDPNVRTGKLENGLTYYVRHNGQPENRADFYIAQKVGSMQEEDNQAGLAHFLEHMAFNGTENFPGKSMLNYLQDNGIKFGTNINAYTSFDETVYFLTDIPTTNRNLMDSALLVLHDWANAIALEEEELESERGVIREEWRTRGGAQQRLWDQLLPEMFPGSKYAKRMPIGSIDVINNFKLFKQRRMALFFIFSMLLGVSLQITNGFANPFIASFEANPIYSDTFGVQHSNILISLSQISEAICILLIPFFLSRFGIKKVILIAMFAWVLRFGLFGLGNPGSGLWLLILSMLVYGVAFDFFNVSGSLFVDKETPHNIRASAQGMFMLMTNGIGATIGTLGAQWVVNQFTSWQDVVVNGQTKSLMIGNWQSVWLIFALYALVVTILFGILFKYKHKPASTED